MPNGTPKEFGRNMQDPFRDVAHRLQHAKPLSDNEQLLGIDAESLLGENFQRGNDPRLIVNVCVNSNSQPAHWLWFSAGPKI